MITHKHFELENFIVRKYFKPIIELWRFDSGHGYASIPEEWLRLLRDTEQVRRARKQLYLKRRTNSTCDHHHDCDCLSLLKSLR